MSEQEQQLEGGTTAPVPTDLSNEEAPKEVVETSVQQTMQIDPALIVDDVNYEKRYDEMQKELERGTSRTRHLITPAAATHATCTSESFDPTQHLARLEGVMASLLSGNCALSREHQTFFLHKGLPTVVRVLTRRRLAALSFYFKSLNSITHFFIHCNQLE
jgi:hypothetical protein